MSNKKIEVVELNKKKERIILEEEQKPILVFFKKYGLIILLLLLILLIVGGFFFLTNIYQTKEPKIEAVTIDTTLNEFNKYIDGGAPITEEAAKNKFLNSGAFKINGEVLLVKTVESGSFVIKFYSDGTAIKYMKNTNVITRINPLENGEYGIDSNGVTNSKAITRDISITSTKTYSWGTVSFFSDGSAEITDSKVNMFVRNQNDINENYISNNKVSYLKESKTVGSAKLNYYYDGTIEVKIDNISYLVRNENDLEISENSITFKNNNQATVYQTKTMDNGIVIDYYQDGGAIIREGSHTISVRKSNSIIIKDNNIYEIVDNAYVEVSNYKGNNIYYTNGGALFVDNGVTYYTEENSLLKYQNGQLSNIEGEYEQLTKTTNIESERVQFFETIAIVNNGEYIAIVPKDSLVFDKDGKIKDITTSDLSDDDSDFTITNNTNGQLNYRIVIEESEKTTLDIQYLRYQLQVNDIYCAPSSLEPNLLTQDELLDFLDSKGNNTYKLIDGVLEPHQSAGVRLMIWTDYDTIPNSMQDKYFYGTIKVYAWIEK